jgi:hypothetical protein
VPPPVPILKLALVCDGFALKVLVVVITKVGFTCPAVIVDVDAITGAVAFAAGATTTASPVTNNKLAVAIEINFLIMM